MKPPQPRAAAVALSALALALVLPGCGSGDGTPSPGDSASSAKESNGKEAQGGSWTVDYATESRSAEMLDLAVASADEAWAIGYESKDPAGNNSETVLLHRTGGAWKPAPLPAELAGAGDVRSPKLDATAPDNVWLFGEVYAGENPEGGPAEPEQIALRWDGTRWHSIPVDFPSTDVAVIAPDDVWALDNSGPDEPVAAVPDDEPPNTVARHWNGTGWQSVPLPEQAVALDARAPDDIWAVGNRPGKEPVYAQPAAMHWDGSDWKLTGAPTYTFPSPGPPEESASLEEVLAVSPKEVYALGYHSYNHGEGGENEPSDEQVVLRWDGSRWSKLSSDLMQGTMVLASDGAGGLVLGYKWHRTASGELRRIGKPPPIEGRSPTVTKTDRKQRMWYEELVQVPGTRQVLGVGHVELGAYGDANFRRGAIMRYDAAKTP